MVRLNGFSNNFDEANLSRLWFAVTEIGIFLS
jgi:hypothetical protein